MQLQLTFPHTELQGAFPANVENLFCYLEVNSKFADWIKNRINQYDFIENQDYIIKEVFTGRRPRKEYYVTLDMAKELCMVENNEKGRQARRYFIECEKRLKNLEQEQMQKLAFRQSLGYKSQLAQQKLKYENEIKALKYDLEQSKNNFKDKLNCILAKNGLYAFDFKTFKNYALKLEKMLKDLKDDENKENKLLLRMQNDFLECLELYKSVNI
ncbi:TPA: antA/AntB antirepressor family protein [Campylobacter jejuni]|nr:antA/AntB antirepressor family protein [Campylobacter jejuni]HEG5224202.1 antA/AntB antirepressor family protein [Campylobacter jejuni]HEG5338109.1 antA/AntB antirepressor family protein [Campylobacter jejuni]